LHLITLRHTHTHTHIHSWYDSSGRGIGPTQRPLPDNTLNSQARDINAPGEIRTRSPNKRAAQAFGPYGHWDRHLLMLLIYITYTHTRVGRTPLDQRSASRGDLYLVTHNTHKRQISMAWLDSNPQSQQASGRTPTLYRVATGISKCPISMKLTGCFVIFHVGSERRILGFSQLNNDNYNNTFTGHYNVLRILSSYTL
jgi:hypothetical protein